MIFNEEIYNRTEKRNIRTKFSKFSPWNIYGVKKKIFQ